jgi:hypothetical protein
VNVSVILPLLSNVQTEWTNMYFCALGFFAIVLVYNRSTIQKIGSCLSEPRLSSKLVNKMYDDEWLCSRYNCPTRIR